MNHNRKHVFTVALDANKGETPGLLMTALAMALFDLSPALHDDESGIGDLRYSKDDVLTEDEASRFVNNGREVSMLFPKGRMTVAHLFASRLSPNEAEIVLTMYDRDGDQLMDRASERLDQIVAAHAADEIPVELDLFDLEDILEDDEPTLRLAIA
ncbi:MAG TPA: hypothetical protein VL500_03285 [Candidatus Eisenbacteria bacterium]|nr:hypothetical protein [Candidatus Eisenbacteria bacterium]